MRDLDDITETIIAAAIHIHRDLGPDLHPPAPPRLRANQWRESGSASNLR